MPVEKLEYPAVLTKAGWDKNKGIAAKMFVGKTDVGASLAEVERLFKEKGFADVKAFAGLDPIEAEAHKNTIVKQLTGGAPVIARALVTVSAKARDAQNAFNKSKTASSAAKTYLANLIKAIVPFTNDVKAYPAKVGPSLIAAYREERKKNSAIMTILASTQWPKVLEDIRDRVNIVKKDPRLSTLHAQFQGGGGGGQKTARSLTTIIGFLKDEKGIGKYLPLYAPTLYDGDPETNLQPLVALWQLANENREAASNHVRKQIELGANEARAVTDYCDKFLAELTDPRLQTYLDALTELRTELEKG
mgnify:CR=1 FL=1|jgi:hypothetical protein